MKSIILMLVWLVASQPLWAQESSSVTIGKRRIYAELGFGMGYTTFSGRLDDMRQQRDAAGYNDNRAGINLHAFFFVEIPKVKGLGVGWGIKGTFGQPARLNGDKDQGNYFYNSYHTGLGAKYFPFSGQYNKGVLLRGHFGFGQFTAKRTVLASQTYDHHYGIGTTWLLGAGYALPVGKRAGAFSLEFTYEQSNRNGDLDGEGQNIAFNSGQLSTALVYSF